jgi:two-component system response regulator NreC
MAQADEPRTVTIVLADDHVMVRSCLRRLLDGVPGFEVVAEAGDVAGARRYVLGHRPDVLVLDLHMPGDPSSPPSGRCTTSSPRPGSSC